MGKAFSTNMLDRVGYNQSLNLTTEKNELQSKLNAQKIENE